MAIMDMSDMSVGNMDIFLGQYDLTRADTVVADMLCG